MKRRRSRTHARPNLAGSVAALPTIGKQRARHLDLVPQTVEGPSGITATVIVDEAESPLGWLARRKGRDGRVLIEPVQLLAGERLRADFTRAHLMPRITANWNAAVSERRRAASPGVFSEVVIDARRRVRQALAAAGPEFSGLLVDVCCFLKGLPDVERDRGWPVRSGRVILQLALDRLARHYGLAAQADGPDHAHVRTWLADDAEFRIGEFGA